MRTLIIAFSIVACGFLLPAVAQDLTITPAQLNFGNTKIDSFATLEFTLENVGVDNFPTITLTSDDSAHFKLNWARERGEAMATMVYIRDIYQASWNYRQDYGDDPNSVSELLEDEYLEIPEHVLSKWTFALIGSNPIIQIEAISTANMPFSAGHVLLFDVQTGEYSGFATPLSDTFEPILVQSTIGAIYNAVKMFRQDYGEYPSSLEQLMELEYLEPYEYLLRNWQFSLIGNPVIQIEAVSTEEMIDGEGHRMLFGLEEGLFSGYRILWVEHYDWLWGGEWEHESITFSVTYRPDREVLDESMISIIFSPAEGEESTFHLSLTGKGVLSSPDDSRKIPNEFALCSVYPNPFNGSVTVDYSVDRAGWTELNAYNLAGERVATIYAGTPALGENRAIWNAADVPSGCYYIRLDCHDYSTQSSVTLIK